MKPRMKAALRWLREWAIVLWCAGSACLFTAISEPILALWATIAGLIALRNVYADRSIASRDRLIEIQHRMIMQLGAALIGRAVAKSIKVPAPADLERARRN